MCREKVGKILAYTYSVGIVIAVLVGALSFWGYIAAILIGGQTATDICVFIYKKIYPMLFFTSSISVLIGLLKMYIMGEKTMIPNKNKKR